MSKYIDAEKLKKSIGNYVEGAHAALNPIDGNADYYKGKIDACKDIQEFISSLQQEQPMPDSTKLIELWHQDKEMLKEKDFRDDPWRLAYNAFMCGFGRGITVNKQGQPEVDLEQFDKDVTKIWGRCAAEPNDSIACLHIETFNEVARHFYELGLNARKV